MTRKLGTLRRIASKTVAAGREHAEKLLKGEETIPEAAGAAVEDLLSGSRATFVASKAASEKTAKEKVSTKKKAATKTGSTRKKSRAQ